MSASDRPLRRASWLSLAFVLAGAVLAPAGLRLVNRQLPDRGVAPSYIPSIEAPRAREPFDEEAAAALREAQPEYFVIGDSMAGTRIDPGLLTRLSGHSVAALLQPGRASAYWYLSFKNLVVGNDQHSARAAIFFFRDEQLTAAMLRVTPGSLDPVARDDEPELDRVLARNTLGAFAQVHRAARLFYQFDRTREWAEPRLAAAPVALAALPDQREGFLDALNAEVFPLERLRVMAAADLATASGEALDFPAQLPKSLLPDILRLSAESGIRVAFVRVQRRPTAEGPPAQSEALLRYLRDLRAYLAGHGAYFHDDYGDQPLSMYADGDHIAAAARAAYTRQFFEKNAALFR